MHTMTKRQGKSGTIDVKALLAADEEFLRALVRTALQEVLEAEMTEALGAEKAERTASRLGYRSGHYDRTLITRVGKLELRVPQDRTGRFSTELFERYQRSERALVAALAEMYVQGVSTRKVKAITEELCGHSFSASSISAMNQRLDAGLAQFAGRPLAEAFPYLILDARYERVREAGVIASQAVLIAIGIDWDGRRQVLAVELANRESRSSWRDFLLGLKTRGLHGVEFVVADDHAGLRQRCARFWRRRPISAAACIFCVTRSTTCRARSTTTACRSCAGCTTGATSPRRAAIWPPGSPSGQANTQSSPAGSKRTSTRR
jgi:transposase-like protein